MRNTLELRIPPPLVALALGIVMWLLAQAIPGLAWPQWLRMTLGLLLALAGAGVSLAGILAFRRARTTVNPLRPASASALVTSGIFRLTRNPMYLGLFLVLCGWAVYLANPAALLLPPLLVFYLNRFQIGPEERILARLFGTAFVDYCSRVRRWL